MNSSSGSTAMSGSMGMSSSTTNISSMNGSTMPHMGVMHTAISLLHQLVNSTM